MLWTDRVIIKNTLGTSLYLPVYVQEPVFLLNLKFPMLKFMRGYVEDVDREQIKLMNLLELDRKRTTTLEHVSKC